MSDYQRLAEQTSAFKGYVYKGYVDVVAEHKKDRMIPYVDLAQVAGEKRLMAAAMGLVGEVGELVDSDNINLGEELADLFWYCAELCSALGLSLQDSYRKIESYDQGEAEALGDVVIFASAVAEYVKKVTAHGHSLDLDFLPLDTLVACLLGFASVHKIDVDEILENNIAKLRARYGDKFSTEASVNRVV